MSETELIEQLADKEHESWNRWMLWLFYPGNGKWNEDGSYTISSTKAKRWHELAQTPYTLLDEPTKQYDRDEVAHILPIIKEWSGK